MEKTRNETLRSDCRRAASIAAVLALAGLAILGAQACRLRSRPDAETEQNGNRALVARADDGLRALKNQAGDITPLPIEETLANRPKTAGSLLTGQKKEVTVQSSLPRLTGVVWQPEKPQAIFDTFGAKGCGEEVAGCTVAEIAPESVVIKDGQGQRYVLRVYDD